MNRLLNAVVLCLMGIIFLIASHYTGGHWTTPVLIIGAVGCASNALWELAFVNLK